MAASYLGQGRYSLRSGENAVDPFEPAADPKEHELLRMTEISKMKGQSLVCAPNAKLIAVNLRYITYVMKEGFVRIINQNGKEMFKLNNSSKARVLDMAINGTGPATDQGTTLICVDEAACVSIFVLEANEGATPEDRARRTELVFPAEAAPHGIVGHPVDNQVFMTLHDEGASIWNLARLGTGEPSERNGFVTHTVDADLEALASIKVELPPSSRQAGERRLRDAAVSADGSCLVMLDAEGAHVWRLPARDAGGLPQMLQHFPVPHAARHSVRALGGSAGDQGRELLVFGSETGCDLLFYMFTPSAALPVAPLLLQAVHVESASEEDLSLRIDVDSITRDSIALAPRDKAMVLVMPLVLGWSGEHQVPFPYAQRLVVDEPAHQLSIMTGRSYYSNDQTLFMYRAHNFTREKDQLPGCNIVVSEVEDAKLVAHEAPPPSDLAAVAEALPEGPAESSDQGPSEAGEPEASPAEEEAAASESGGEEEEEARLGEAAPGGAHEAASPSRRPRRPDLDWGLVKQVAASFVRSLEKRRGEMADRIVAEVSKDLSGPGGGASASEMEALEQALAKVQEAREAQTTGEKNVQSALRATADQWAEASAAATAGVLQKELGKISDGVAATLAQQLSQSRKFSEALAQSVQRSGGIATKQALESLRPPKQLQETVGAALGAALHESLTGIFKTELRAHFAQELAPLIGQRVGEMMSSFRDRMGECLEGIAAEHEQAARRLRHELATVIAEELRQVESIAASKRGASAPLPPDSGQKLTEQQVDELAHTVHVEVVQPLHARIRELSAQVQALREEARQLELRWSACSAGTPYSPAGLSEMSGAAWAAGSRESEEAQARDLERLFREGRAQEALLGAVTQQARARHLDFVERLCALAPEPIDAWLTSGGPSGTGPLDMRAKMSLMLCLARQLDSKDPSDAVCSKKDPSDAVCSKKVEWINELWLVFEPDERAVASSAATLCGELVDALERIPVGRAGEAADSLRRLKRSVTQTARILNK